MKKIAPVLLVFVLLTACASSADNNIATSVAQTVEAQQGSDTESGGNNELAATPEPADTPTPTPTPVPVVDCESDAVATYLSDMDEMWERWDDAFDIANSTPRMSLSPVITQLQDIKREARRLDRPGCADYLQDIAVVAMEKVIDAFISFLSQDGDSVVSRKLQIAEDLRAIVDAEFATFEDDPLAAYSNSAEALEVASDSLDAAEPFVRPNGWVDEALVDNEGITVSIPDDWRASPFSQGRFTSLTDPQRDIEIILDVFDEPVYQEYESDFGRLFDLQTFLETADYDFYSERSATVEVYALNRAYVVEFSRRISQGDDILPGIFAVVILPSGEEVFLIISTEDDDFAQIDHITFGQIMGSLRIE